MSAIAGIVFCDGREVVASDLERLIAATAHIGREGVGKWFSGAAGMLRFRHATTPEAVGERQPYWEKHSGDAICLDGRLDNRPELLALLQWPIQSMSSDCEIALALHAKFGDGFLNRLVGDYALAIWSPRRRRLFCARSPLGWRPFLWTFDGGRFAFASQPRTLIDGAGMTRKLNEGALGEYLSVRFVTLTETFWQGLQRLPGGEALAIENGRLRTWRWHGGPFEDFSRLSESDHIDRFRTLFDTALISATRSITPVVSQLSGGLDSSSVVCRATELHRCGQIQRQLAAISVRYPGEVHDETQWSESVEKHLGLKAIIAASKPLDWDEQRAWCAKTLHLPLRPNVMPSVCECLRGQDIRVLLTGEGGDDWLSGSRGHWPDLVHQGRWAQLYREVRSLDPLRRIKAIALDGVGPIVSKRRRERVIRPHLDFRYAIPQWIEPDWARRIGLSERWRADALPIDLPTFAQRRRSQLFAFGRRHVNLDNILAYTDSCGIEVRHPLHDLRLTQFLMGAAGDMLLRDGQKKYLLREAMRGTLPEVVRTRSTKANFSSLLIDALMQRFRERKVEDLLCVKLGWVKPEPLVAAHAEHTAWRMSGGRAKVPRTHYGAVWFAVATDSWLEHAFHV